MGSSRQAGPTVWETIFGSPIVVGAARVVIVSAAIVLLFGGLYIAISIAYRMRHGQWLQRAGPFEAHLADEGNDAAEGMDTLLKLYADAAEENRALIASLGDRDEQVKELSRMKTKSFEPRKEDGDQ